VSGDEKRQSAGEGDKRGDDVALVRGSIFCDAVELEPLSLVGEEPARCWWMVCCLLHVELKKAKQIARYRKGERSFHKKERVKRRVKTFKPSGYVAWNVSPRIGLKGFACSTV
jgi:hypothetical protein